MQTFTESYKMLGNSGLNLVQMDFLSRALHGKYRILIKLLISVNYNNVYKSKFRKTINFIRFNCTLKLGVLE